MRRHPASQAAAGVANLADDRIDLRQIDLGGRLPVVVPERRADLVAAREERPLEPAELLDPLLGRRRRNARTVHLLRVVDAVNAARNEGWLGGHRRILWERDE